MMKKRTPRRPLAASLLAVLPIGVVTQAFGRGARELGRAYAALYDLFPSAIDPHDAIIDLAEHFAAELVNGYHESRPTPPGLCDDCRAAGVHADFHRGGRDEGRVFYGTQRPSPTAPTPSAEFDPVEALRASWWHDGAGLHCLSGRCVSTMQQPEGHEKNVPTCGCVCDVCISANVAPPAPPGVGDPAGGEEPRTRVEGRAVRRREPVAPSFEIATHVKRGATRQE